MSEKKPKDIEELVREIIGATTDEHKKNIKLFETHMTAKNQHFIDRQLIHPAFYGNPMKKITGAKGSYEKQIEKEYSTGKVDIKDETKIQRVLVAYMRGFFETAMPSVLTALPQSLQAPVDSLKKDDLKTLYETLSAQFDTQVGVDPRQGIGPLTGLDTIIKERFEDEEEVTADMISGVISELMEGHKKGAIGNINKKAIAAYIGPIPGHVYATHIMEKAKRRGYKINDKKAAEFLAMDHNTILGDIHLPHATRQYDDIKYKKHGFKLHEEKEERRAA